MIPGLGMLLGFVGSPIGKIVAIGLALLSAYVVIDRRATYKERARCEAAALRSQLAAKELDLASAKRAADEDRKAAEELAARASKAEGDNAELQRQIAALPKERQCIVTDDDIKRMRRRDR